MTDPQPEGSGSHEPAGQELISIEEFSRIQLRTARVLEASRHPNADKLLKLRVDLGGTTRQLVAGIAGYYEPEELIGQTVIVVANLKPARLRGEVSEGMLLAAVGEDDVAILQPIRPVPPGSAVR